MRGLLWALIESLLPDDSIITKVVYSWMILLWVLIGIGLAITLFMWTFGLGDWG